MSRIAYGFTAGIFFSVVPKIIQETFPHQIYKKDIFFLPYLGYAVYQLLSLFMIFNTKKKDILADDTKWAWFNLIPVIMTIPALFYFHFIHVHETLISHIRAKEQFKAIDVLKKIMKLSNDSQYKKLHKMIQRRYFKR